MTDTYKLSAEQRDQVQNVALDSMRTDPAVWYEALVRAVDAIAPHIIRATLEYAAGIVRESTRDWPDLDGYMAEDGIEWARYTAQDAILAASPVTTEQEKN